MTHGEKAAELKKTLNCAQSVAVSLSDLCGLDENATPSLELVEETLRAANC